VTVGTSQYVTFTDERGNFTLSGLTPGVYDIRVKGSHTLSNLRSNVMLNAGLTEVDFGMLREGDANNDNCVSIVDFSILANAFFPRFDPRADFNQDGLVNIVDFNLLRENFGLCGQ
jgi:hypothetical protein